MKICIKIDDDFFVSIQAAKINKKFAVTETFFFT